MKPCPRCIKGVMLRDFEGRTCIQCGYNVLAVKVEPLDIPEQPERTRRYDRAGIPSPLRKTA